MKPRRKIVSQSALLAPAGDSIILRLERKLRRDDVCPPFDNRELIKKLREAFFADVDALERDLPDDTKAFFAAEGIAIPEKSNQIKPNQTTPLAVPLPFPPHPTESNPSNL